MLCRFVHFWTHSALDYLVIAPPRALVCVCVVIVVSSQSTVISCCC